MPPDGYGRQGAERLFSTTRGTAGGGSEFGSWDELQDPLSSFVPDFNPVSAGFFFALMIVPLGVV